MDSGGGAASILRGRDKALINTGAARNWRWRPVGCTDVEVMLPTPDGTP